MRPLVGRWPALDFVFLFNSWPLAPDFKSKYLIFTGGDLKLMDSGLVGVLLPERQGQGSTRISSRELWRGWHVGDTCQGLDPRRAGSAIDTGLYGDHAPPRTSARGPGAHPALAIFFA